MSKTNVVAMEKKMCKKVKAERKPKQSYKRERIDLYKILSDDEYGEEERKKDTKYLCLILDENEDVWSFVIRSEEELGIKSINPDRVYNVVLYGEKPSCTKLLLINDPDLCDRDNRKLREKCFNILMSIDSWFGLPERYDDQYIKEIWDL